MDTESQIPEPAGTTKIAHLLARLNVAYHALRGWAIICGVRVSNGDVEIVSRNLYVAAGAALIDNHVTQQGQVILVGKGHRGNRGHVAVAQNMREARWIARRMRRG